ncbi:uncharacterized protein LOC142524866 isoform X3 [Primulina tabacum]|uniref:uncharacterized protein LOC142524866 isoform X3 n=1 Tax=Primulina tabacum TaxID=48773 RepID=UPI003F5A84FE
MLRLKCLRGISRTSFYAKKYIKEQSKLFPVLPFQNPSQRSSCRFLDIYQIGNKEAIEKERARLKDEMNRGYFADMAEMKQHDGKIAMANKIVIPASAAAKFPMLEVCYSNGSSLKLPITSAGKDVNTLKLNVPKATLLCLSFRASAQISFIDSWLLSRNPIKKLLLKIMRKPKPGGPKDVLQRQIVYSFGDNYYFRKELRILNLLTGYIFLLDKMGRIRWQGFGSAEQEELLSLLSCTSLLLDEK